MATLSLAPSGADAADCQALAGKRFDHASIVETSEVAPPFTITNLAGPKAVSVNAPAPE